MNKNNYAFNQEKITTIGDYVRYLTLMSIQTSKSGHPGMPLGCADIGAILFHDILNYNSEKPHWLNRDRFVLSAGHGSMFLYSFLYLAGFPFSLDNLLNFRQYKSITAGHPEYNIKEGIEVTTGPLGQGIANSVGMAIEGKMLGSRFNKNGYNLFDYSIFTILGDGCHMEGISYEAMSLAGHLKLENLIAIYDDNSITIDGSTSIAFTEDIQARYEALNWHVEHADANNIEETFNKILKLKSMKGKPKVLVLKTTIGKGLEKLAGTSKIHGAPAGVDEIAYFMCNSQLKEFFAKKYNSKNIDEMKKSIEKSLAEKTPLFENEEVLAYMKDSISENKNQYNNWVEMLEQYKNEHKEEYAMLENLEKGIMPSVLRDALINYKISKPTDATRNIGADVFAICTDKMPSIIGGNADLVESTKATVKNDKYIEKSDFTGRNIAFGIREHAMGAIANGIGANKLFIPFTSTFFVFSDYMRAPIRLAALMSIKHLFVFSHDSIYVGEDGPTHQPVEHLNSLRLIPNLTVLRPASDMESAFSYLYFLENDKPVVIILSRQNMEESVIAKSFDREIAYNNFKNGAYIFHETNSNKADIIIIATGSELGISLEAAKKLEVDGKNVRVVSMPSMEIFANTDDKYRASIIGTDEPILFVEASSSRGLNVMFDKRITSIDIEQFGVSGPADKVAEHFGFTLDNVYNKAKSIMK